MCAFWCVCIHAVVNIWRHISLNWALIKCISSCCICLFISSRQKVRSCSTHLCGEQPSRYSVSSFTRRHTPCHTWDLCRSTEFREYLNACSRWLKTLKNFSIYCQCRQQKYLVGIPSLFKNIIMIMSELNHLMILTLSWRDYPGLA